MYSNAESTSHGAIIHCLVFDAGAQVQVSHVLLILEIVFYNQVSKVIYNYL